MVAASRTQIKLAPAVLQWARERVPLSIDALARKLNTDASKVQQWEETGEITVSRVNKLAQHTYTPLGFLYLDTPPNDDLPIHDFRTHRGTPVSTPSPNLLDTVLDMQRRQEWMTEELAEDGADPLPFVGSASIRSDPVEIAHNMREQFGLVGGWAKDVTTWGDALRHLREHMENAGILVVFNGVVRNNTHRPLDTGEFRGFALADRYAPLVFVNGSDTKSAQMFTLAHESAHLWIGASGVSNLDRLIPADHAIEQWCNAVAAEFLVPKADFLPVWRNLSPDTRIEAMARHFKVSQVVIARRALDFKLINEDKYHAVYEHARNSSGGSSSGGNFWNTQNVRIGRRFGSAVIEAAQEGRLLYSDAYRLTGLNTKTFPAYIEKMGY